MEKGVKFKEIQENHTIIASKTVWSDQEKRKTNEMNGYYVQRHTPLQIAIAHFIRILCFQLLLGDSIH